MRKSTEKPDFFFEKFLLTGHTSAGKKVKKKQKNERLTLFFIK